MENNAANEGSPVVLITGAAGGLGRGLVHEFLRNGRRVIAAAHRADSWTDSPIDAVLGDGSENRLWLTVLDVADRSACQALVKTGIERFGRIDCLVNNAGLTADDAFARMCDDDWQRVIDVNLKGAFLCSQAVSRPMASARSGHIINISSWSARNGTRGQANYASAKAGLIGLTQSLAKELGSRNVRVNAVLPGVLSTAMTASLTPEQLGDLASSNALGRIGTLDEVARFIVALSAMQHVSGQVFQLDSRIASWT